MFKWPSCRFKKQRVADAMPHNDDNIKMILEILQAIWAEMKAMRTDFKIMLRILQNQGAPDDVSALQGQNTATLEEDPITDEEEH